MTDHYQFGMYNAPEIQPLGPNSPLYGKNVYFITPYKPGFAISATLGFDVDVTLHLTTWDGEIITKLTDAHMQALSWNEAFIPNASSAGINRYQIFFSADLVVTDFVEPQGQFISPGMLAQLFGASFSTQTIVTQDTLDRATVRNMLIDHAELIIKPSVKMTVNNDKKRPLYARISQSMAPYN